MHAAPLYPFSVKTRLKGRLHTLSLDNCVHAHTHTHKHFTAAGSLIIAITNVTAVSQLMISVLYTEASFVVSY